MRASKRSLDLDPAKMWLASDRPFYSGQLCGVVAEFQEDGTENLPSRFRHAGHVCCLEYLAS
jgi:hypothetical protein